MNLLSLSEIIRFGIPCRAITVATNTFANYSAVIDPVHGTKYTYLLSLSTNVAMASFPRSVTGKCVIKSIVHSSNT